MQTTSTARNLNPTMSCVVPCAHDEIQKQTYPSDPAPSSDIINVSRFFTPQQRRGEKNLQKTELRIVRLQTAVSLITTSRNTFGGVSKFQGTVGSIYTAKYHVD